MILFFRDKDDFIKSLYNEMLSKGRMTLDFETYKARRAPLMDYEGQLTVFREVFSNVRDFPYEEARDRGLVPYFFNAIGVPAPPDAESVWVRKSGDGAYAGQPLATSNAARMSTGPGVGARPRTTSRNARSAHGETRRKRPRSWLGRARSRLSALIRSRLPRSAPGDR